MNLPTQAQINAALRYAGTTVGSAGALISLAGVLPPDLVHSIVEKLQKLFVDLGPVANDLYALAPLLGAAMVILLARAGIRSASPQAQVEAVKAADPQKLVVAVQSMPTAQVLVTDPALAPPGSGVQVVDKLPPAAPAAN